MKPIDWKTIKEYEDILFDYYDGIAKITINRPQVYNAFRPQTNCEMLDAMFICRERSDIGVIILTGSVMDLEWSGKASIIVLSR